MLARILENEFDDTGGAAGGGWEDDIMHAMVSSSPGTGSAANNAAPLPMSQRPRRKQLRYDQPGALAQLSGRSDIARTGLPSSKYDVLLERRAGQEALSLLRPPPPQDMTASSGVQLESVGASTRARSRLLAELAKETEEERRRIAQHHG